MPMALPRFDPSVSTWKYCHADTGKELYEPLWADLVRSLGQRGVKVRGIWIADVAWQGQSGIINEGKLGYDSESLDHYPFLSPH